MRRREFSTLLGGAATVSTVSPSRLRAQQKSMPVVGLLGSTSYAEWANFVVAFRQGLSGAEFVEGRGVAIEYRWAASQFDRLPALATDLVGRQVTAIVAMGGSVSALAAKASTATIPAVFVIGADPVKLGLVASLNRPGGNVTGVSFLLNALVAKRLELMRELVLTVTEVGLLVSPRNPNAESDTKDVQAAARALGLQMHVVNASSEIEFTQAFASLVEQRITALLKLPDPFFISRRASNRQAGCSPRTTDDLSALLPRRKCSLSSRSGHWSSKGHLE